MVTTTSIVLISVKNSDQKRLMSGGGGQVKSLYMDSARLLKFEGISPVAV